jgi:hypothetical protein
VGGIKIMIQSRGIDSVEGYLPDHPMVGVENVLDVEGAIGRVVGEDRVGADLTDHSNKVSAKFQGFLKLPVGFPEKNDFLGPNHPSSRPLFFLPKGGQGVTGKGGIIGSLFAAGADAVEDLRSLLGPPGHGSPAAEVHIIRMGADDQDPLAFPRCGLLLFQSTPLPPDRNSTLRIQNSKFFKREKFRSSTLMEDSVLSISCFS